MVARLKELRKQSTKDLKFKDTSISLPVGFSVLYSESPPVLLATTSVSKLEGERAEVQVLITEQLQEVHLERL